MPSLRAVIDTNILVSALIFNGGKVGIFRQLWQENQFQPLVSRSTVTELIRVLAYPKFKLTFAEQQDLLADYWEHPNYAISINTYRNTSTEVRYI